MYDFSDDSVLLCLSSEHYDSDEYIRDYNEFVRLVNDEEKVMKISIVIPVYYNQDNLIPLYEDIQKKLFVYKEYEWEVVM